MVETEHLRNVEHFQRIIAAVQGISDRMISEKAAENQLQAAPVSKYSVHGRARCGLLLGYTAFNETQIKNGVESLAKVLKENI